MTIQAIVLDHASMFISIRSKNERSFFNCTIPAIGDLKMQYAKLLVGLMECDIGLYLPSMFALD